MTDTALITGITGQDGSYLTELLLGKNYVVHGLVRRSSSDNLSRLGSKECNEAQVDGRLVLHVGDVTDATRLQHVMRLAQPTEVYHLAAQTDVGYSFKVPDYTTETNVLGTMRVLEAVRSEAPHARVFNASSAEAFGLTPPIQTEASTFKPCSPYGASKAHAFWAATIYRESHRLHISNGLFFNHESERRGPNFVTRKISRAVAEIVRGTRKELRLGSLDAVRDWGYAPEYVTAMWLMLQQPTAGDFIAATGVGHTVAEFCEASFAVAGLDWRNHVVSDDRLRRPCEPLGLVGDASKARTKLGWSSVTSFQDLVAIMVSFDIEESSRRA